MIIVIIVILVLVVNIRPYSFPHCYNRDNKQTQPIQAITYQKGTNHPVNKPPLIPLTNQQSTNLTNDLVVTHRLHAKGKVCH